MYLESSLLTYNGNPKGDVKVVMTTYRLAFIGGEERWSIKLGEVRGGRGRSKVKRRM
jgi:hypothetical protein